MLNSCLMGAGGQKRNQNKTLKGIVCKSPKSLLVACLRMSCSIPAYGAEMVYERKLGGELHFAPPPLHRTRTPAWITSFQVLAANMKCSSLLEQIKSGQLCQVAAAPSYLLSAMGPDGTDAPPRPPPLNSLTSDMWTHITSTSSDS